MSEMNLKRDFVVLSEDFRSGEYNLKTVSGIIVAIRSWQTTLIAEQISKLLEIPLNVLENDVDLKSPDNWAAKNRDYFYGNVYRSNGDYINELKEKFQAGNYDLDDLVELLKYIQANVGKINIEFVLRIIEVTLRDDVKLQEYSTFNKCGRVFARYIDEAIGLL